MRIKGATSAKEAWDTLKEKASEDYVPDDIDLETRKRYAVLYVAALKDDWGKAEDIYKNYPGDVVARLSDVGNTALHVAAAAGHINFVKQLVMGNYMKENDLEKKNKEGDTAFTLAAMSGNVQLALLMIEKNKKLAMIRNGKEDDPGMLPVQTAALLGLKKMVNYLYRITKEELKNEDRIELLVRLIDNDLYDIALLIVKDYPELAYSRIKGDHNETALHVLAQKPLPFIEYSKQGIWQRCYYHVSGTSMVENKKMDPKALKLVELLWGTIVKRLDYFEISELIEKPWRLIYVAAKEGNIDFLSILIREHPDLIYRVDKDGYSIFHTAVKYRRENIFQLVYQTPSIKNTIVASQVGEEKNTILHLAAMLPADQNRLNVVSGAALQMQRELWWFKVRGVEHRDTLKEKASEDVQNEIAALEGDWAKAEAIYKDYPGDAVARLSDVGDTALHVAAAAGHTHFVEQLVKSNYMKKDDLEKKNKEGYTALTRAAMSGNVQLALPMIEKNKKLAIILNGKEDNSRLLPIQMAAMPGLKNMVDYLYTITSEELKKEDRREELKNEDRIELLVILIDNNLYDVALLMVKDNPELALLRVKGDQNETALHALARKPMTFNDHFDNSKQGIWKRCCCHKLVQTKLAAVSGTSMVKNRKMNPKALELVELLWEATVKRLHYYKISELIEKPWPLTYVAAKEGNIDFLSILMRKHPALIFKVDNNGYSLFHTAVKYRRANIFQLVHQTPSIKNTIVTSQFGEERNTILHLAAELPPDPNRLNVEAGPALQMQLEFFWFKEVSKLVPPCYAELENRSRKTARTLFTENHKNLMKEGEECMKRTYLT
ncbi:hypothetical protein JRO89_XSUnG0002800 [Xanthoceras sorbifolium]|uniref:Uncharacterized protein n=1 Tax=Xanthoceras sorbifolium TaxID=99658 RepID=A0ABQ8H0E2_9ROSI|nr:hypothetical protein JRO89_XSUnG0002800 [Xanthoceras sorbifolium]